MFAIYSPFFHFLGCVLSCHRARGPMICSWNRSLAPGLMFCSRMPWYFLTPRCSAHIPDTEHTSLAFRLVFKKWGHPWSPVKGATQLTFREQQIMEFDIVVPWSWKSTGICFIVFFLLRDSNYPSVGYGVSFSFVAASMKVGYGPIELKFLAMFV